MQQRSTIAMILMLSFVLAGAVGAASHTWSGGGATGNWSEAANWSDGGAPLDGEAGVVLVFPAAQAQMSSMVNDLTGLQVTSIAFADTRYGVTGNAIELDGSIVVNGTSGNQYSGVAFALPIQLTGPATFSAHTSGYYLRLSGVISGPHPVTVTSIGGAGGIVYMMAANTYSGITTIASGEIFATNAAALGAADGTAATGTVVPFGGSLALAGLTIVDEALTIGGSGANGNGAIKSNGVVPNLWTGPVSLTAASVITALSQAITISGVISGGHGLHLRTAQGLTLTADNPYTGATTFEYGQLYVDGLQPTTAVTMNASAFDSVLGGNGRVGSVAMTGGARSNIVSPGTPGLPGVLATGNLSLNDPQARGRLAVQLDGTTPGAQYDQVDVTGTVDVTGAALDVTVSYGAIAGHSFTVIANDGADAVVGTFAGLAEGAQLTVGPVTLQISYQGGDGNDVVLLVTSPIPVELQQFDVS